MDLLPRYHLAGYTGTVIHLNIVFHFNRQVQGAHPPDRLPHKALTIHEVAAPYYEDIVNPRVQGAHPSGRLPITNGAHNP